MMRRPAFLLSLLLAGPAFAQTSPSATPASVVPSSPPSATPTSGVASSSSSATPASSGTPSSSPTGDSQSSNPVPLDVFAVSVTVTGPNYTITGTLAPGNFVPTGPHVTYISYSSTITLSASGQPGGPTNGTSLTGTNANNTAILTSASSSNRGTNGTTVTLSGTRPPTTVTSSSARPSNTRPCNGYPELCSRKYSNITNVCAHNSPFTNPRNVARNQEYGAIAQLNDGVRMLQGQTHYVNDTLYFCHTSCDLLNAGTVEAYLTEVAAWVETHPYDVVTILLGNADFVWVTNYTAPIQNSGLAPYLYYPPEVPMALDDWPTLGQMITRGKRVVIFMDYMANQAQVPYILDQFSQMWETPFSPTDVAFPCTVERPPDLQPADARNRMYMANHNLNVPFTLLGFTILVPNVVYINQTNGVSGVGSLGRMAEDCLAMWNRAPNFLLVDFYSRPPNGTVFEVAAMHNGVTYRDDCCGDLSLGAAATIKAHTGIAFAVAVAIASVVLTL